MDFFGLYVLFDLDKRVSFELWKKELIIFFGSHSIFRSWLMFSQKT